MTSAENTFYQEGIWYCGYKTEMDFQEHLKRKTALREEKEKIQLKQDLTYHIQTFDL